MVDDQRGIAMGEAFRSIVEALSGESNRGTVVLAVSWLDDSLTAIIKKLLKPTQNETLLNPGQPLGDLGTKIILAERLQLISPQIVKCLTICRRLRNDFAHLASDLSFETPNVKDRVFHLFDLNDNVLSAMGETLIAAGLSFDGGESDKISVKAMHQKFGTKQLFCYTCGLINSGIAALGFDVEEITPTFTLLEE